MQAAGCNGDSRPPSASNATVTVNSATGVGGSSAAGGASSAGGSDNGGGAAGETIDSTGTTGGSAGAPGPEPVTTGTIDPDECGDGTVGQSEDCEPDVEVNESCVALGFETGQLACNDSCRFDTSGCSGTERCLDGRDNDGDGAADCLDSDCDEECATSCGAPQEVADGSTVAGSTEGRPSELDSSCASGGGSPELVFQVTATTTGKLDVVARSSQLMTVSLRESCASDDSEVACRLVDGQGVISADVTSGDVLFVAVEGFETGATANVTVEVGSRPANECGDSFVDELEQCDDGDKSDGDGCDGSCQVESNESEPNDTPGQATAFLDPSYAMISPAGDIDHFAFSIDNGPKDVAIDVLNLATGFCTELQMDPYVELLDESGDVIAADDDGGEGYCSKLTTTGLGNGNYTIAVSRSASALPDSRTTFGYQVVLDLN